MGGAGRDPQPSGGSGLSACRGGLRKAREAAERALSLDANLAEAHAALGRIKTDYDWDWAGADASFQRALALEPSAANGIIPGNGA